jgi:hypothetical protein
MRDPSFICRIPEAILIESEAEGNDDGDRNAWGCDYVIPLRCLHDHDPLAPPAPRLPKWIV